ncbi:hypothetical protein D3C71_1908730 [compost metagenome]
MPSLITLSTAGAGVAVAAAVAAGAVDVAGVVVLAASLLLPQAVASRAAMHTDRTVKVTLVVFVVLKRGKVDPPEYRFMYDIDSQLIIMKMIINVNDFD